VRIRCITACVCKLSRGCSCRVCECVWATGLGRADARLCVCVCHWSFGHAAAGATSKLVIASAPWAARYLHTTVIDAAGAIYVIGGYGSSLTYYNDAWSSADGGAGRARGALNYMGTTAYAVVVRGSVFGCSLRALKRRFSGTPRALRMLSRVLWGYRLCTLGVLRDTHRLHKALQVSVRGLSGSCQGD
jgi:hypothetical protein